MNIRDARPQPVTERQVQAIWYDAALRPPQLRTTGGELLVVTDPGVWNTGAGPDFRNAVLGIGPSRRRLCGDAEVHLRPVDWHLHGHGRNPDYRNVVVHVTWYGGPAPDDLPPQCLTVCLGDAMRTRTDFAPDAIDVTAYPFARLPAEARPCSRVLARDPDLARTVLQAAGKRRIAGKARLLAARLMRVDDPEQVFYEEIFAALGYAGNVEPFRALAAALPLADLPFETEVAREALACVAALEVAPAHPWRTANLRPANSPASRMRDAAALFTGGKPERLGAGRAAAVLANVIVPFALARGALPDVPDWLPPEDVSAPMRLTAFRLFGRDHNPALYTRNGLLLQGLIGIHREFCLAAHPDCGECALKDAWIGSPRPPAAVSSPA